MPDLENITPVNTQEDTTTEETSTENKPVSPPPSNEERAAAKAEKEAEEKKKEENPGDTTEEKPAEETKEEEEKPAEELDTTVWGDTGDEVANSTLLVLQNAGVSTDEAKALLWDAVEAGDPSKVDKDALIEKVGKANATLIMAGIENVTSRNNDLIAEVKDIAHKSAGSPENWETAVNWAKKNLSEEDLDELRGMIDKGGRQASFATKEIVARYNADPKNTSLTAGETQLKPDGKSETPVKGISRLEYGKQLDLLFRKGIREGHPEFKALQAQRAAGRKQGL